MAKPVRFTPTKTPQGTWRLNIPAKHSESGRRERHFFRTRDLATAAAAKLKDQRETFGSNAVAIAPSLAEQATAAARLLDPYGATILEVVRQYVEREAKHRASVPIEKALQTFAAAHPGWSDSHARTHRLRAEKLTAAFAGRQLASITGEELHEHVVATTNGAASNNLAVRLVGSFFRWAAKQPRAWCDEKTVEHLDKVKEAPAEIGVLTADQAAKLLATAEEHFPDCVVPFAIALFTGLRQAELERLRACDIKPEGVTVPAMSAKTKRRRFIAMPEPLADWLAAFPVGEQVCPINWQRKEKAVRRLAGWRVWSGILPSLKFEPPLPAEPPDDLPEWPSNALRHTAATVAVGMGKPLESLIFEHGHSGGVALLKRHYLGVMPKAEAIKIWGLRPHAQQAETIRIA